MGDDGKLKSIVIILQDVTTERAERDAIAHTERMATLGELVSGASHELNNPLAIITGYTDILLEDSRLTPDQRQKVELIRKSALRASTVVQSLRTFARKGKPERKPADINVIVQAALQLKRDELHASGVELDVNLFQQLPPIFVDANHIRQALVNLLNNAQDAFQADSTTRRIRVETELSGKCVIVRIADTGLGISRSNLKRVFDPFFTTKPIGQGTGLGLSISYGIVREHGGEIHITSHPRGTEVSVELPVYQAASSVGAGPSETSLAGLRLLVVDDELEIGAVLKSALSRMGFAVESASSAQEALSLAAGSRYDFVLTDVRMPGCLEAAASTCSRDCAHWTAHTATAPYF
jgi:two-component system NtrC family sensor kinase